MHPKGQFVGGNTENPGTTPWRECSVGGDVFSLRESRSAQQKGEPVWNIYHSIDIANFLNSKLMLFISLLISIDLWRNEYFTRRHIDRFMWCNIVVAISWRIEELTGMFNIKFGLCISMY